MDAQEWEASRPWFSLSVKLSPSAVGDLELPALDQEPVDILIAPDVADDVDFPPRPVRAPCRLADASDVALGAGRYVVDELAGLLLLRWINFP